MTGPLIQLADDELRAMAKSLAASYQLHFPIGGACQTQLQTVSPRVLLTPVSSYTMDRLRSAQEYAGYYLESNIEYFRPVRVRQEPRSQTSASATIGSSMHCGPICEQTRDGIMVVDGLHRLRAAMTSSAKQVTVWTVITSSSQPPPAACLAIGDMQQRRQHGSLPNLMDAFDPQFFRPGHRISASTIDGLASHI